MALAGAYLLVGLLMHMIAFSGTQEVNQKIECTFDDNILSAESAHQGTVDPSEAFRWKGGKIPYFFKGRVTSNDKRVFYDTMKQIEDKTCFKFEENSGEPREYHLEISVGSPSCASRGFSAGVEAKRFTDVTLRSSYQLYALVDSSQCNWRCTEVTSLARGVPYQYSTCERYNKSRSCKLSSSESAFDGRGASESVWELLRIVAGTVCSDKPTKPTSKPTGPVTPPPSDECRTVAGPSTGSECVFPFRFAEWENAFRNSILLYLGFI